MRVFIFTILQKILIENIKFANLKFVTFENTYFDFEWKRYLL